MTRMPFAAAAVPNSPMPEVPSARMTRIVGLPINEENEKFLTHRIRAAAHSTCLVKRMSMHSADAYPLPEAK